MSDLYSRLRARRERQSQLSGDGSSAPPETIDHPAAARADRETSAAAPAERDPSGAAPRRAPSDAAPRRAPGPDWNHCGDDVWERSRDFSFGAPHNLAELTWTPTAGIVSPAPALRVPVHHTPLFLDVETTGLSSGAGNVAFLIGIGWLVPASRREGVIEVAATPGCDANPSSSTVVRVTQLFLADFGGEARMLTRLEQLISAASAHVPPFYVTYNGGSFDLPVLRTRFIMHRRRFPERPHVDLLHPTRRLFAPVIGSCTLGSVERRVLGLGRTGDVPSAEVPLRYHEFLSTGDPAPLAGVFRHHAYDIAHLAALAGYLNAVVGGTIALAPSHETRPDAAMRLPPDPLGLARLLLARGDAAAEERVVRLLEQAITDTDRRRRETLRLLHARGAGAVTRQPARLPVSARWVQARELRAAIARRRGETDRVVQLREELAAERGDVRDAIALAIAYEHVMRDPARAMAAIAHVDGAVDGIGRRRERLARKMEAMRLRG